MGSNLQKTMMPAPTEALPGREQPLPVAERHFVNGNRLAPPFPAGLELALFGLGCFWGADRLFRTAEGLLGVARPDAGHAPGRRGGPITTEVLPAPEFFYAEDYHQQYLAKNPDGYCGIGGTGVACSDAPAAPAKARA